MKKHWSLHAGAGAFSNHMERQPKRDFLFIDETGDPGRDLDGGSSVYFGIGAVHVTDLSLESLYHLQLTLRHSPSTIEARRREKSEAYP